MPIGKNFARHDRCEIKAERGADDDLPRLTRAARGAQPGGGKVAERHRDERPDHPGQRQAQPGAERARGAADDEREDRVDPAVARGPHLPMQKREKISPSRSSATTSPVIAPSATWASRSSSAKNSQRALSRAAALRCMRAFSSARRCRSRARNTDSPVSDQPAAFKIALRSASIPAPVLAETATASAGGL